MDVMKLCPMVPQGTTIPYGLSRYRSTFERGFRFRLPVWVRCGVGYGVATDQYVHGRWVRSLFVRFQREAGGFSIKVACAEVLS